MLPAVVPNARIWTFNFESKWIGRSPIQNLESLGGQLRRFIQLKVLGVDGRKRPIVFIAHSFGGIVVTQALTLPSSDDDDVRFLDCIKGMVFLGTPFRGSPSVPYAKAAARAAEAFRPLGARSSSSLLDTIIPGAQALRNLVDKFSTMAVDRRLNLTCFFEQCETALFKHARGPFKALTKGIGTVVVPEDMACLEGHRKLGLRTSHTNMNEFDDPEDDPNYQLVSSEIRSIARAQRAPQRGESMETSFVFSYWRGAEGVGYVPKAFGLTGRKLHISRDCIFQNSRE
jgi:hypothetical protein